MYNSNTNFFNCSESAYGKVVINITYHLPQARSARHRLCVHIFKPCGRRRPAVVSCANNSISKLIYPLCINWPPITLFHFCFIPRPSISCLWMCAWLFSRASGCHIPIKPVLFLTTADAQRRTGNSKIIKSWQLCSSRYAFKPIAAMQWSAVVVIHVSVCRLWHDQTLC